MLDAGHSIFTLAVILVAGVLAGWAAKKIRLPQMTGQIVIGALLGPSVIGLVSPGALHELRPMTHFALGLIAVAVGNHLNLKHLKPQLRQLLLLLLFEVTLTPVIVFAVMWLGGERDLGLGLMFAAMAIATAPATVVAIIAEAKARGSFVRTLLAGVALNNMACIVLFEIARGVARQARLEEGGDLLALVGGPALQLLEPLAIGLLVAAAVVIATQRVARSDLLASASVIAILFTAGISELLQISPLLSCLFLGVGLANFTPDKDEIGHRVFQDFENAIFAVFFTLAGMELDFAFLAPAGLLAGLFVCARFAGKVLSARFAMTLAGASDASRRFLGLGLIPQAGVAIGLVFVVQDDPVLADVSQLFLAVGITAVAINEVIGPLTTRFAVQRSGEAGRDEPGVIEFLRPADILTDLGPIALEEAVERLVDRLAEAHSPSFDLDAFRAAALEEAGPSAYVGHGLAIPHAEVEAGGEVIGVMGLSVEGFDAETADGEAVHCVVLLATPEDQADRHLEVVTEFARAIRSDRIVQQTLYAATDPQRAFELLHAVDEETDLNVILKEAGG